MREQDIENALKNAPRPQPPAGLGDRLEAGIRLPSKSVAPEFTAAPFWRRWFPALAFGSVLLACMVVLGVQTMQISNLRQQNSALRQATADLPSLEQQHEQLQNLAAAQKELQNLQRDHAELLRLRDQVTQLRQTSGAMVALEAENARLRQQIAAVPTPQGNAAEDFFERQRDKAKAIQCINDLKQIGLAARLWSNENGDTLPQDFLTMKNELGSPKILHCPADEARVRVSDWAQFTPANASYEILAPGVNERDPNVVFARCPVHGAVVLVDGSAHMEPRNLVQRDGKFYLGR
jgi:hypothetical protein